MKVAIIDYQMGNVASVEKAINFLGYQAIITNDPNTIEKANYIILPGVGAFSQGMKNLNSLGLIDILNQQVLEKKKPFLGICLGMQLVASKGYEPELTNGLGWISGDVIKIDAHDKVVPHLGWNEISTKGISLISDLNNKDFYFIHSYHFKADIQEEVIATVNYGQNYTAVLQKNNILATQFHPEKSQTYGLEVIKRFLVNYA